MGGWLLVSDGGRGAGWELKPHLIVICKHICDTAAGGICKVVKRRETRSGDVSIAVAGASKGR